ncbi:MAG: hypothetical protein JKY37_29550 [Nannocystaceae bacterium]|nr:hypothetical protein [Nannocystaceae bacterium]
MLGFGLVKRLASQRGVSFKGDVFFKGDVTLNSEERLEVNFHLSEMARWNDGYRHWSDLSSAIKKTTNDGVTTTESLESASIEELDALSVELATSSAVLWAVVQGRDNIPIEIEQIDDPNLIFPCDGPG